MTPIPWPNGDISVFETVLEFFQRNSLSPEEGRNLTTQREFSDNNISGDAHSAVSDSDDDDDDGIGADNTKAEVQRTDPNDFELSSNCTTTIFRDDQEEDDLGSASLRSSHVVMVGVPAEIAVAISLASFLIGASLTGMLCCIHHRRAMSKTVRNLTNILISRVFFTFFLS